MFIVGGVIGNYITMKFLVIHIGTERTEQVGNCIDALYVTTIEKLVETKRVVLSL